MPISAIIHIHIAAPKPPRQMAVATPTMLPVPTREAVDTISALNEDIPPSCGFSEITLIASPKRRSCTNLVLNEKKIPAARSTIISTG